MVFLGVGSNLNKLLPLSFALCVRMNPVNDFIIGFFCRMMLLRYVCKLL